MAKKIQIDEAFFMDVYRLVEALKNCELDYSTRDLVQRIEVGINVKIDALERREVFTKYKTSSPGTSVREDARNEYCEKADIFGDFISKKEVRKLF